MGVFTWACSRSHGRGASRPLGEPPPGAKGCDSHCHSQVVLAPTRELAVQIAKECERFGGALGIASACVYGGAPREKQLALIADGVHILVATPGRVRAAAASFAHPCIPSHTHRPFWLTLAYPLTHTHTFSCLLPRPPAPPLSRAYIPTHALVPSLSHVHVPSRVPHHPQLNDFLESGTVRLDDTTYAVLDEADRMLDLGFEPQIRTILKIIGSRTPRLHPPLALACLLLVYSSLPASPSP